MSVVREVYRVTVRPGRNPGAAAMRLADNIVARWMPNNAGGAPMLLVPGLTRSLAPFFGRDRDVVLEIDTRMPQVQITEVR